MHDVLGKYAGKMGHGLLRYSQAEVVVVIDRQSIGRTIHETTGIQRNIPIVGSVQESLAYGPDVLVLAMSPPGGRIPSEWRREIEIAMRGGMSIVNGLHDHLERDNQFSKLLRRPGQFIWDIRKAPMGVMEGAGRAGEVAAKRILFVGTDMSVGKMTAALELDEAARNRGLRSKFLATGQIGIAIAGSGVALDAVPTGVASGAIEQLVLDNGPGNDILFIEGQGSLLHPASCASLALIRGAVPTHMVLVHRAKQMTLQRAPWVQIPPLRDVIQLYDMLCTACARSHDQTAGTTVAVALNTAGLTHKDAQREIRQAESSSGLPTDDVVRNGGDYLLGAILAS